MKLSFDKRQEIISYTGKFHADFCGMIKEVPISIIYMYKPEGILPFSKKLIMQAFEEELIDPNEGARIRNKNVDEWRENIKAMQMILDLEYINNDRWIDKFKEGTLTRDIWERDFLNK